MFIPRPIGFVSSQYKDTSQIPKGLGAKHEVDGVLRILPEFEAGLTDIEGFSHLMVLWEFDRADGFALLGTPPSDNRAHGVFATRSPRRLNPIGLTVVELLRREALDLHVRGVDMLRRHSYPRYQTLFIQRPGRETAPWLARRSRSGTEEIGIR
ncbi:MAG: tRNA (N6-threonylcarbamoyladenosine(37)-N6)-methyltransferase TrmO [Candidatus Sulfotelmatobacter sp.]